MLSSSMALHMVNCYSIRRLLLVGTPFYIFLFFPAASATTLVNIRNARKHFERIEGLGGGIPPPTGPPRLQWSKIWIHTILSEIIVVVLFVFFWMHMDTYVHTIHYTHIHLWQATAVMMMNKYYVCWSLEDEMLDSVLLNTCLETEYKESNTEERK